MRVTTKGQVTIPQEIREKLGIAPPVEIDFVEEKDRVYLEKRKGKPRKAHKFRKLRGIANVNTSVT